jgi:hypothetical protein
MHHINQARFDHAEAIVDEVLAQSRASGDSRSTVNSLVVLSLAHNFRGRLDESFECAAEASRIAGANAYRVLETSARCLMASTWLARGQHPRALPLLAACTGGDEEGALNNINLLAVLSGAFLCAGRLSEARETADRTRDILAQNPSGNMFAYPAHFWLPEVYLACWREASDPRERRRLAKAAHESIGWSWRFARAHPVGRPLALRHRAAELELLGRASRGAAMRTRALAVAIEFGMAYEAERARRSIGPDSAS